MSRFNWLSVCFVAIAFSGSAYAQEENRPLSAIDWFNQHYSEEDTSTQPEEFTGVPAQKQLPSVEVTILGEPTPDSVGLLSPAVSGLPSGLWKNSETSDLVAHLDAIATPRVPALNALLARMMLAEAEGPVGEPGEFLLARGKMLTRLGTIEPAISLIERAGPDTTQALFRQWAELKLLDGSENELCNMLIAAPSLLPDYEFRIFCLSRSGDWSAAATMLLGAETLEQMDADLVLLLTRFLDPELFEDAPLVTVPEQDTSPLQFRLYEAVGEPLPTTHLPLAFAHWDLKGLSGWKAQLTAGERLAVTGAVSENRLMGIYSANLPSASGGVFSRVATIQELDDAVAQADPQLIGDILPEAWELFEEVGLRSVLANLFADDLMQIQFRDPQIAKLAHELGLLSRSYQFVAWNHEATEPRIAFLNAVASGQADRTEFEGILPDAIRNGFKGDISEKSLAMISEGRTGEALLHAISMITEGQDAPPSAITEAIALFTALGLSDTARQYSLQLLLDRDPL